MRPLVLALLLCLAGGPARAEDAPAGEAAAPAGPVFVALKPMSFSILDAKGKSRTVSLSLTLELVEATSPEAVTKVMPRLLDAFVGDLYRGFGEERLMVAGRLDIAAVKTDLVAASARILGDGVVVDVLVSGVVQRGS